MNNVHTSYIHILKGKEDRVSWGSLSVSWCLCLRAVVDCSELLSKISNFPMVNGISISNFITPSVKVILTSYCGGTLECQQQQLASPCYQFGSIQWWCTASTRRWWDGSSVGKWSSKTMLTNTMLTNVCSLFWLTDLGQWADWCSSPGNEEECLGELGVGQVGDGIHDGIQTVHWDHDHHEAGQVKSNNPERERKNNLAKDFRYFNFGVNYDKEMFDVLIEMVSNWISNTLKLESI